jgi:hypothetical protein
MNGWWDKGFNRSGVAEVVHTRPLTSEDDTKHDNYKNRDMRASCLHVRSERENG